MRTLVAESLSYILYPVASAVENPVPLRVHVGQWLRRRHAAENLSHRLINPNIICNFVEAKVVGSSAVIILDSNGTILCVRR